MATYDQIDRKDSDSESNKSNTWSDSVTLRTITTTINRNDIQTFHQNIVIDDMNHLSSDDFPEIPDTESTSVEQQDNYTLINASKILRLRRYQKIYNTKHRKWTLIKRHCDEIDTSHICACCISILLLIITIIIIYFAIIFGENTMKQIDGYLSFNINTKCICTKLDLIHCDAIRDCQYEHEWQIYQYQPRNYSNHDNVTNDNNITIPRLQCGSNYNKTYSFGSKSSQNAILPTGTILNCYTNENCDEIYFKENANKDMDEVWKYFYVTLVTISLIVLFLLCGSIRCFTGNGVHFCIINAIIAITGYTYYYTGMDKFYFYTQYWYNKMDKVAKTNYYLQYYSRKYRLKIKKNVYKILANYLE